MASDNPLFGMGFPGPQVSAREIDSLPSRLAQARGVQQAATTKANAAIDTLLEPARQTADGAVGRLLEPVEQILTEAGQTAAHAVSTGQVATVKALQQPLVQALKYGYVNQGTPVLSPTGKKTRGKRAAAAAAAAAAPALPAAPPPPEQRREYTVLANCQSAELVLVPGVQSDWIAAGWIIPAGWTKLTETLLLPSQAQAWLQANAFALGTSKCGLVLPPG